MKSPLTSPLIAYMTVQGAAEAIEFYKNAFDARERFRLIDSSSGKIGHAELELNGSVLKLADENPQWNQSPTTLGGTTVKFCLLVENADVTYNKAVTAGATPLMPVGDQFYGYRCGTVRDPFGHEWLIEHIYEEMTPEEMQRRWDEMTQDCKPS